MIRDAAIERRQPGDTAKPQPFALQIDPYAVFDQRLVGERGDTFGPSLSGDDREQAAAIVFEREANIGASHRKTFHYIHARGIFGARRAQEFAASRHSIEQMLDANARTGRQRCRPLPRQHAVVDHALPAIRAADPAFERQPGNAGDRGQRLAAKAQCRHRLDRLVGQLRGRMPFERQRHIVASHAATVVHNFYKIDATAFQSHRNPARAGVDRVFNQFLQRTGGPFHHFTGGDTIDELFGEAAY